MSLFALQLRGELLKLFARKRTYIGFGAFLLAEVLFLGILSLERVRGSIRRVIENSGYPADEYLSGLTLALFILLWTVFLLGALYLALVAGDVVGKEVEDGTLRLMLCRPVSRGRVLAVKVVATAIYSVALTLFIAISALLAGFLHSGFGSLFVFAPTEGIFAMHEFGPGLARYALATVVLSVCLLTIPAVGFFFSCCEMKPAAATILTLSFFFLDTILKNIPYFESLRAFFITARMSAWARIFEFRIPWSRIAEDLVWLGVVNATLLVAALVIFEHRDFKT